MFNYWIHHINFIATDILYTVTEIVRYLLMIPDDDMIRTGAPSHRNQKSLHRATAKYSSYSKNTSAFLATVTIAIVTR